MFCGISIVTSKGQLRHTPEIVVMEFQNNGFSDDCLQELSVQHQKHISTTIVIASSLSVPDTYNFIDYTKVIYYARWILMFFVDMFTFVPVYLYPPFSIYTGSMFKPESILQSNIHNFPIPSSSCIINIAILELSIWRFPAMRVSPISPNHPFYFRMETLIIFTHHREMPTVAATCPGPRNSTLLS